MSPVKLKIQTTTPIQNTSPQKDSSKCWSKTTLPCKKLLWFHYFT